MKTYLVFVFFFFFFLFLSSFCCAKKGRVRGLQVLNIGKNNTKYRQKQTTQIYQKWPKRNPGPARERTLHLIGYEKEGKPWIGSNSSFEFQELRTWSQYHHVDGYARNEH